jgi:site-specific recombinase XerD
MARGGPALDLLGYADIRTTSRYAHLSRESLFAAV